MRRPLKEKEKRLLTPDYKYDSEILAKFINYIMLDGEKGVAEKVIYDALDEIKKQTKDNPLDIFNTAITNVGPAMEVRSRRVGGANYQVPYEVRSERRLSLAMRWILQAVRGKKGTPTYKKLADELIAASKNEGEAMKVRENIHRMAEANKAFAHFAWTGSRKKRTN